MMCSIKIQISKQCMKPTIILLGFICLLTAQQKPIKSDFLKELWSKLTLDVQVREMQRLAMNIPNIEFP